MKRKQLLLIAILVALVAGYFVYSNFFKTAPGVDALKADYKLTAQVLYSAFEENETEADALYLNKILEVTGQVEALEFPDEGAPSIALKTDGFGVIKCTFEAGTNADELKGVEINQNITIKGECLGYLLDVQLIRSIIIE